MITPAEIEAVARAACKEMGLDADEVVGLMPRWMVLENTARQAIAFHRAIEAVKGAGK